MNTIEIDIYKNWDAIVSLMDEDARERVHYEMAPCTELEFLERYIQLDPDFENVLYREFPHYEKNER